MGILRVTKTLLFCAVLIKHNILKLYLTKHLYFLKLLPFVRYSLLKLYVLSCMEAREGNKVLHCAAMGFHIVANCKRIDFIFRYNVGWK